MLVLGEFTGERVAKGEQDKPLGGGSGGGEVTWRLGAWVALADDLGLIPALTWWVTLLTWLVTNSY